MISQTDAVMTARMIGNFYAELGEWMKRNEVGHLEDVVTATDELGDDPADCFGVLYLDVGADGESEIYGIVHSRGQTRLSREFNAMLVRHGLRINLDGPKAQIFPSGRVSKE